MSTGAVSRLIDNRLAIEPLQQVQRTVLSHQPVYSHLGACSSAGLILRYCVTSCEPASEQRDAVTTGDMGERRPYAPPVNQEGHGLAADVDIHALPLELKGGELTGLQMFAGDSDGDVFRHFTPPACVQSDG